MTGSLNLGLISKSKRKNTRFMLCRFEAKLRQDSGKIRWLCIGCGESKGRRVSRENEARFENAVGFLGIEGYGKHGCDNLRLLIFDCLCTS